jgi:hypothetical protein
MAHVPFVSQFLRVRLVQGRIRLKRLSRATRRRIVWVMFALLCSPAAAESLNIIGGNLSAEAYVARQGGTLIPPGRTEIDGHRMACGTFATVLDPYLGDFGGAPNGYIILNPDRFAGLATPVKLWIYSHECAHQTVGANEVRADCVAVQRGHREGWLTAVGLAQVCDFMKPAHADTSHFTGIQRCELMRQCFRETIKPPSR